MYTFCILSGITGYDDVMFVLHSVCQALLFYLPVMVWRNLNSRSGIDLNSIVEAGETFQNTEMADSREKNLTAMTKQMDRCAGALA